MPVCVFEGEGVGVSQMTGDQEVQLGWEGHKTRSALHCQV